MMKKILIKAVNSKKAVFLQHESFKYPKEFLLVHKTIAKMKDMIKSSNESD